MVLHPLSLLCVRTMSYDDRLHKIAEGSEVEDMKRSMSIKPPSTPQPTKVGIVHVMVM